MAIGTSAINLKRVNKEAKSQGRFTKMIIIVSFMFIIVRLLYGLMGLFQLLYGRSFRTMIFFLYESTAGMVIDILLTFFYGMNFFVLFYFNNTFKKTFKNTFCFKKIE